MVDPDICLYPHSLKRSSLIDSDYFWNKNMPYSGKIIVGPTMLENSAALISLPLSLRCLSSLQSPPAFESEWVSSLINSMNTLCFLFSNLLVYVELAPNPSA